jgi:hypothetical protein
VSLSESAKVSAQPWPSASPRAYKVALIARGAEVIGKVGSEIKDAGGVALPIQSDCDCRVANRVRA